MEISDRTVKCATCGRNFLFTAKEQEFFMGKGFKEPRHCRECRQQRKQERDEAIAQATGQPLTSGREMFKVICAQCQRETLVPFKPITGKPVLCKDCFIAQRYGSQPLAIGPQAILNSVPFTSIAADLKVPAGHSMVASQVNMGAERMMSESEESLVSDVSMVDPQS
jgi:CxxC-x17-CxxC domain-containing protein